MQTHPLGQVATPIGVPLGVPPITQNSIRKLLGAEPEALARAKLADWTRSRILVGHVGELVPTLGGQFGLEERNESLEVKSALRYRVAAKRNALLLLSTVFLFLPTTVY
jgi:hypothetical protein